MFSKKIAASMCISCAFCLFSVFPAYSGELSKDKFNLIKKTAVVEPIPETKSKDDDECAKNAKEILDRIDRIDEMLKKLKEKNENSQNYQSNQFGGKQTNVMVEVPRFSPNASNFPNQPQFGQFPQYQYQQFSQFQQPQFQQRIESINKNRVKQTSKRDGPNDSKMYYDAKLKIYWYYATEANKNTVRATGLQWWLDEGKGIYWIGVNAFNQQAQPQPMAQSQPRMQPTQQQQPQFRPQMQPQPQFRSGGACAG